MTRSFIFSFILLTGLLAIDVAAEPQLCTPVQIGIDSYEQSRQQEPPVVPNPCAQFTKNEDIGGPFSFSYSGPQDGLQKARDQACAAKLKGKQYVCSPLKKSPTCGTCDSKGNHVSGTCKPNKPDFFCSFQDVVNIIGSNGNVTVEGSFYTKATCTFSCKK